MNPISFHLQMDDPRLAALSEADDRMGALITLIGEIKTAPQGPHFAALARSIISQQISVKAAATIRGRVLELAGELSPDALSAVNDEALRGAGLSASKVAYLRDLSGKVQSGEIVLERLHEKSDDAVIQALTSIKGIGRWTAEMFLIFGLGRENVVSVGMPGFSAPPNGSMTWKSGWTASICSRSWIYGALTVPSPPSIYGKQSISDM